MSTVAYSGGALHLNRRCLLAIFILLLLFATGSSDAREVDSESTHPVYQIDIQASIGPVVADWISRSLDTAAQNAASLFIIRLDTPGGLVKSMRMINQAILASPVPVAVYVYPKGAHAASAGTYMLYAAHIAAMAPATNLGAATPVEIGFPDKPGFKPSEPQKTKQPGTGEEDADAEPESSEPSDKQGKDSETGTLMRKQINDSVAYIRSLAELHGRNADWAEKAVREAVSLEATQALEQKVIDFLARDTEDLLTQLEGKTVIMEGSELTLSLSPYEIMQIEPDWRHKLLSIITDPSIAYILMLVGIYGLIFEFYNPGMGGPGILGAICLLMALFALQLLPISYAGLGLIILGIALMVAEALSPTFGVLGVGGGVAFVIGSVMLMDTDLPGFQIAWPVIAGTTVASAAIIGMMLHMALRSRKQAVVSGAQDMVGRKAEVVRDFSDGEGRVRVHGEVWRAQSKQPMQGGDQVVVTAMHGLTLEVARPGTDENQIKRS